MSKMGWLSEDIAQWGEPFIIPLIYVRPSADQFLNDFLVASADCTNPDEVDLTRRIRTIVPAI